MDYQKVQAELDRVTRDFFKQKSDLFSNLIGAITDALKNGRKILVFGNGGSAAEAQHFAAEMVNRLTLSRRPFRAMALSADTSVLTSIANDSAFDCVFSRQIEALGEKEDIALALSTSGTSLNIIKALEAARAMEMTTIALTGEGGGLLGPLSDFLLDVPSRSTPRIQEVHLLVLHLIAQELEERLTREQKKSG